MTELTALELWEMSQKVSAAANRLHEAAVLVFQSDLNDRGYKAYDRLTDLTDLLAEAAANVEEHLDEMQKAEVGR